MSAGLGPATQAPPLKPRDSIGSQPPLSPVTDSGDSTSNNGANLDEVVIRTDSLTLNPVISNTVSSSLPSAIPENAVVSSPVAPSPAVTAQQPPVGSGIIAQQSQHLLEDPKLQEIMMADVGSAALLSRIKQSIASAREFATFVKKKAQFESEHQASMKKLSKATRESIKKPEGRQGTFVTQFDEIVRVNERVADIGQTFVAALHKMHDDLNELARTCDKTRKNTKERSTREEKNLTDAEQLAERAKSKYDSLADDFERMRTGDPARNKFGLKQKSGAQHEEELHRKVMSAESEYRQKVDAAQRARTELVNKLRPVTVRELKNLILECDSGISLQLAKYANLSETLALNSGFIIAPLKPESSSTAALTMKEVAAKVDNELDFYNYVLQIPKTRKLNRPLVVYKQHPSLASAYPISTPAPAPIPAPAPPPVQQSSTFNSNSSAAAVALASTAATGGRALNPVSSPPNPAPPVSGNNATSPPGTSKATDGHWRNNSSIAPGSASIASSAVTSAAPAYPPGTANKMPVYGTDLEGLLDFEEGTVPRVVYQCIQAVDSFGLEVEGIYRHAGQQGQVQEIKRLFDTDSSVVDLLQPNANLNDIHSVAAALKLYFLELPNPLLCREYQQEFLDAASAHDTMQRRDAIHATINKLPDANYSTLRYLTFHLHRVQEREATNRMSIDNLGLVWGPIVMTIDNSNPQERAIQARIMSVIIFNAYTIFDAD